MKLDVLFLGKTDVFFQNPMLTMQNCSKRFPVY